MQEEPDSEHGETDGVTVNRATSCTPEWSISKVDYEKQTV